MGSQKAAVGLLRHCLAPLTTSNDVIEVTARRQQRARPGRPRRGRGCGTGRSNRKIAHVRAQVLDDLCDDLSGL